MRCGGMEGGLLLWLVRERVREGDVGVDMVKRAALKPLYACVHEQRK